MQRNFYKRFWLEIKLDEWKKRFVNRVNDSIFSEIKESAYKYSDYRYEAILKYVCSKLWEKFEHISWRDYWVWPNYFGLNKITWDDFEITLYVLEIISKICNKWDLDKEIKYILFLSQNDDWINLWIRYHNGLFYLSWDKELDEEIIEKSLDNIKWFKAENDYIKVLKKYLSWDLNWTLSWCFTTLETLSQEILWNSKWLKANREEILKYFWWTNGFSKQWGWNINLLYDYLNDFSERHNWDKREIIDALEVEATIYQIWLIINLLIHKYNELWKQ